MFPTKTLLQDLVDVLQNRRDPLLVLDPFAVSVPVLRWTTGKLTNWAKLDQRIYALSLAVRGHICVSTQCY